MVKVACCLAVRCHMACHVWSLCMSAAAAVANMPAAALATLMSNMNLQALLAAHAMSMLLLLMMSLHNREAVTSIVGASSSGSGCSYPSRHSGLRCAALLKGSDALDASGIIVTIATLRLCQSSSACMRHVALRSRCKHTYVTAATHCGAAATTAAPCRSNRRAAAICKLQTRLCAQPTPSLQCTLVATWCTWCCH